MSVKLRKRENLDGTTSLILDIYDNGKRTYEFLKNLRLPAGNSLVDRQTKKEALELAKKIVVARAHQLDAHDYDVATEQAKKINVVDWMKAYAKSYKKADIRVIDGVIGKFSSFLTEKKLVGLLMKDLTESLALQFRDKLKRECRGEGAKSYYSRFRKIIKQAYRDKLLVKNPCEFIDPPAGQAAEKDVLTADELQVLARTVTEAPEVKRAFLFCTQTGLRWIDVKKLTWSAIHLAERKMKFTQSKTGKAVQVPLNSTAIALLGKEKSKKELVFDLPTANGCNKSLKGLVQRAKIAKSITWHCGRHSFGTSLIYNKTDIFTASQLLVHASLAHTKRYVRASQEMNQKAVDSLPKINL
jgi:integrase/recombinase XerD